MVMIEMPLLVPPSRLRRGTHCTSMSLPLQHLCPLFESDTVSSGKIVCLLRSLSSLTIVVCSSTIVLTAEASSFVRTVTSLNRASEVFTLKGHCSLAWDLQL